MPEDLVERLRRSCLKQHQEAAAKIESLRAKLAQAEIDAALYRDELAEVTRELKVLSDFCDGVEDRSLLHKGGLKCLVDEVQKQSDNYARALTAGAKRLAELHQMEEQLIATQSKLAQSELHAARLVEALAEVIGCFDAAFSEGLQEALAETQDERLKDLVERRLMYALYAAQEAAPAAPADAVAKDAERYRWLVRDANGKWLNKLMDEYTRSVSDCARFDAAIDAAMQGKESGK